MSQADFGAHLRARVAGLGLTLTDSQAREFEKFYELLAKWNRRINLTALELGSVPSAETLDRLFIEPLIAAEFIPLAPLDVVDLGSGAGSPALPLKILRPAIRLMMVETRGRKAAFLREAVRTLQLSDAEVEQTRFQSLPAWMSSEFDFVVVRALRINAELLTAVAGLLKPSGRFMTFGVGEPPPGFALREGKQLPGGSYAVTWVPTEIPSEPE